MQKTSQEMEQFKPSSHFYFGQLLKLKEQQLFSMQTSHIMVLYFIVHGLSAVQHQQLLDKEKIRNYIMSLYLKSKGGFICSSLYTNQVEASQFILPHIVFTYSALNCLQIVGGLDKVDKKAILQTVSRCQKENGSFSNFETSSEADLRFVYAALSICNIFQDFSFVNTEKIKQFINSCYNFDGGYGLRPNCETHSGAIYCAVASLKHMKVQLDQSKKQRILKFLVNRQTTNQQHQKLVGVQGRVGKLPDSCYSYWVGASIQMLAGKNLLNDNIIYFLSICYDEKSHGFSKFPFKKADPLHTLHSNVGLYILKDNIGNISLQQGVRK